MSLNATSFTEGTYIASFWDAFCVTNDAPKVPVESRDDLH